MKYLASLALLASTVSAHGGVTSYSSGGTTWKGWEPYMGGGQTTVGRQYSSFDPLMFANLNSVNMICNNAGVGGSGPSITIAAGAQLTAHWAQWTHAEGCIMVYMAKCPGSCTSFTGTGAVWFKIDQVGLISGTMGKGKWGSGQVQDTLKWTATIPASLPAGEYLIRHELLALHQANNPQFYPECAQLIVTGGGSGSPSPLVAIPGLYKQSDPNVNVDIYMGTPDATSYTCPGPSVWGGGSSNPNPNPTTTRTTTAGPRTTTTTSTTTSRTTTTTSRAGPSTSQITNPTTVPKWGQCGGIGWNGGTTCASGSTCNRINDYYSQCT